jgi:hypothetical protein
LHAGTSGWRSGQDSAIGVLPDGERSGMVAASHRLAMSAQVPSRLLWLLLGTMV